MDSWKLADAKNRLSEVIDRSETEGAQAITRHGKRVAYIVSVAQFDKLSGADEPMSSLYRGLPKCDAFADIMDEIVATRPKTFDKPNPFEDE